MNAFSLPRLSRLRNIFSIILTRMTSAKSKLFLQTFLLGVISAALYFLLYTFEDWVLERRPIFSLAPGGVAVLKGRRWCRQRLLGLAVRF